MRLLSEKNGRYIDMLVERYPVLGECKDDIAAGYFLLEDCYTNGGKLLAAGNGGSSADSEHIVGELMKSFQIPRPVSDRFAKKLKEIDPVRGETIARDLEQPLMAISLTTQTTLMTAYINDVDKENIYAQQLYGYGKAGDIFLGISTSGNSRNIINTAVVARALGIKVLGLTGKNGDELAKMSDVAVRVPEEETYLIQELHLPIYHCWCHMLEEHFYGRQI